ncbi:tape measure protein [Pseudoalteromonas sp. BDTF-M6]|uniref:tape measure protein n=1 Tax=Pseudoalteromonas sp. BDTF-M6 TaxID=2796132 RepID=UPI001BAE9589|nr:tape measure protein [Pseudoalteromonas sp. BDTF-M6]MBS3796671.1 tape measure protein [Pseudoalteromonas sp. BDTF-M6]
MSNNLNLALRLRYDGRAVSAGARQNVAELNRIPQAISRQVAANQSLGTSQAQLMAQQGAMSRQLGLLERSYNQVGAAITTLVGIGTATMYVRDTSAAQMLDQRLKGLTGSSKEYAEVQEYLFSSSDRLNTNYTTLADSYSKILNLQQVGVVTQEEGRAILEGMANAAAKTGASNVQLEQSLFGMTQGMTAGVLRAEELNQVTEPLPGLLQKLDQAAGMAAGGFRQMVNDGQVTSQMFKQYLVKALNEYAGAAEATEGKIKASFAEMSNEYQRLVRQYEEPVNFAVTGVIDATTEVMQYLRENEGVVDGLATSAAALAAVLGGHLAAGLTRSAQGFIANVVAKNRALVADAALAKQSMASAALEHQRATQQQAYAAHTLKVARTTDMRTAAIARLAAANQRAIATEAALTAATNTYSAAATRASLASRTLGMTMGLLGGPVGIAVTAGLAIAYFASQSDDATDSVNQLKKATKDLNPYANLTSKQAEGLLLMAQERIKGAIQLADEARQRFNNPFLKGKFADVEAAEAQVTKLKNEIVALQAVLNIKNEPDTAPAAGAELPENIKRLELSLLGEEARLKASYEKRRDMVIKARDNDVANKAKYDAILKNLDTKYGEDVKALTAKREADKTRIQNQAEEARRNALRRELENRIAVVKGFAGREALAAYNNEMAVEQARQQARIDAKRREQLGLDANDEKGELEYNTDNQIREMERQQELLAAQGYHSQREAHEAAHQERLVQIGTQHMGAMQSHIMAFANFEKQTQAEKASSIVGYGAAMFKTMGAQSKKAFKAYKAFAISQAIINTYQSATGAFNSLASIPVVGPVLGGAAAAAAVLMGMQQVRQIKAQQPAGIAHGGLDYVPNESTYLLQRGERVLSPKQNTEISAMARHYNAGSQAGGSITFDIVNQIMVEGGASEQQANRIGGDIGRQIEAHLVQSVSENGPLIRAIRSAA